MQFFYWCICDRNEISKSMFSPGVKRFSYHRKKFHLKSHGMQKHNQKHCLPPIGYGTADQWNGCCIYIFSRWLAATVRIGLHSTKIPKFVRIFGSGACICYIGINGDIKAATYSIFIAFFFRVLSHFMANNWALENGNITFIRHPLEMPYVFMCSAHISLLAYVCMYLREKSFVFRFKYSGWNIDCRP